MEFENCGVQILEGCEFDFCPCRNLMKMGRKFGFDLVVIHPQMGFFDSPRRHRDKNQQQQGRGTAQDALGAPKLYLHLGNLQEMGLPFPMMKILT